ncbi:hypothetical protein [Bradyrhizobium sp. CCBAU 51753]|uniref:hypothetical protein n=1 Tax=Bradyrhizobium sp. CCBAU 51753 TaxID=1325100 RepID=UPI001889F1C9|nr:hypothetical protein [Bradyrhizobium sp. CCBAU 51753]QOZ23120.1 hypothetical protein XH93_05195 [Bradyrhizobium sp. CCBAU 51753]
MASFLDRITTFVGTLASGPTLQPKSVVIKPERCKPDGCTGVTIAKDECYLRLTINELFLADARRAFVEYQPMVVSAISYIQGNEPITVPSVVGPSLLSRPTVELPQSLLLNDIDIAGPLPYRGGNITISLVLYRVRHTNYARDLLNVVEGVSKAIGPAADLGMLSKISGALLDGVESLLGLGDTEPVMGHRFTMSPVGPGGMKSFYAALVPSKSTTDDLSVDSGRLRIGDGAVPRPYSESDYILYNLSTHARRTDVSTLPFFGMYERAKRDAFRGGKESWAAAKATFSEVWQQMMTSPDLIPQQAEELFIEWKQALLAEKTRGDNFLAMSTTKSETEASAGIRRAAELLNL